MSKAVVHSRVQVARKWHALAERQRAYYVELYRSDRWRRFYSDEAFHAQMKAAVQNVETWDQVLAEMGEAQAVRAA
jgi:uncharacterized repeat protein (TIGR03809 family)